MRVQWLRIGDHDLRPKVCSAGLKDELCQCAECRRIPEKVPRIEASDCVGVGAGELPAEVIR